MQQFKSVYFADYPTEETKRRSITLAFGSKDQDIYGIAKRLSSESIRQAIGLSNFNELNEKASEAGMSLNAYCLDRLRDATEPVSGNQLPLAGMQAAPELRVDPIQATFRGGIREPLHGWYPYLEGYSPDFVESALKTFAPNSKRILDPFGGSGTTPLTVSRLDRMGFFCELNPLLQFVVETKSMVLALSNSKREALADLLTSLSTDLSESLDSVDPDRRLGTAYEATFGTSKFFPENMYDTVCRLRTWLDDLECVSKIAADVATVAVVASLIPASNLIRRGDLRFRKSESEIEQREKNLVTLVEKKLTKMIGDMRQLDGIQSRPLFVASDAKRLSRCADLKLDAVVTSPPYLNGTNYYRNTKVELWFLRALLTGKDLAAFRRQTVTAGINDVTVGKNSDAASKTVEDVVKSLQIEAYDKRIPQMILSYFADMDVVINGLAHHLVPNAPLLIDIGDSAYSGVHVDTPAILAELMESRGWRVDHEVTLRQRVSRSGVPLRQVLIAASAPRRPRKATQPKPNWHRAWKKFQSDLPHQKGVFAKRNWGSPLHSLCSYQGKMKPSLARHLAETFLSEGAQMADPFGGVGTIPFEAASIGAKSWSFDISPAAVPIALAKLQTTSVSECKVIVEDLRKFIAKHRVKVSERKTADKVRFNGPLSEYFHPKTFNEVLLARRYFQENPPQAVAEALVFSSLLHVLHGNRPYALSRRSHPITPFSPTGETEYKRLTDKVSEKVERALSVDRPDSFVSGESLFQDATALWPLEVDNLDAVITSPPFFDSTRFYSANWMRLWFAGWTAKDFNERPQSFVDERQKEDFRVYESILRQSRERLKPGGVCVLHLGKSRKCDMAQEIARVANAWFSRSEVFAESVAHCESHGIRDKGTVVEHTYLVLY